MKYDILLLDENIILPRRITGVRFPLDQCDLLTLNVMG